MLQQRSALIASFPLAVSVLDCSFVCSMPFSTTQFPLPQQSDLPTIAHQKGPLWRGMIVMGHPHGQLKHLTPRERGNILEFQLKLVCNEQSYKFTTNFSLICSTWGLIHVVAAWVSMGGDRLGISCVTTVNSLAMQPQRSS